MRRLLLAVLVTVLAVTGCSGAPRPELPSTSPPPAPSFVLVQLGDDPTDAGREAIGTRLREAPGAAEVEFATREQNYERFRELNRDRPGVLEGIGPEDLSDTFRARFADRAEAETAASAVRELAGVREASVETLPTPTASPS